MRALYANTDKGMNGFTVKEIDGVWHWMGIVSNNWLDKQFEWISAKAHRRFVDLIESGEYGQIILKSWLANVPGKFGQMFKEIAERGTPDLWYWHIPVPIGFADMVDFDERGYLIASGRQKEGEFYSSVFKAISESPVLHGMSHGMPMDFIGREQNERVIGEYISTEFTALPDEEAANWGTSFTTAMKEAIMRIPERKANRMKEIFGEDTVARFDALLDELEVFAEDSEIPRKEKQVMDETTAEAQVEEVEEVEAEEVETTEAETEEEAAVESEADESEDEETEEVDSTGMSMDPDFTVPTDFKAFAEEMVNGLKEVMTEFQASQDTRFQEMQKQLDEQRAELAKLKEGENERIAQKAAETPIASMAGWLATEVGSVIGKEDARIHGNKERELYNKTKASDEADDEVKDIPGVPPSIAKMITRQRGRGRNVRVPTI